MLVGTKETALPLETLYKFNNPDRFDKHFHNTFSKKPTGYKTKKY